MKNSVFNFLFPIFCCFLLLMLLAGCGSDDKDEPEPVIEPEADYTVILYGCGGGDLDHALRYNLDQVAASGYSPKVQFTGSREVFGRPARERGDGGDDPVHDGGRGHDPREGERCEFPAG